MGNLAANSEEAQGLITEAGAIPLLTAVLVNGSSLARQHSARALRNLAGRWACWAPLQPWAPMPARHAPILQHAGPSLCRDHSGMLLSA